LNKILVLIISVILSISTVFSQHTKEVLFIGNSYTYANNLPDLLKQIALSFGDTLLHDSSTPGGATFNVHSTSA
tara:strand:- start:4235 stop:4456 length:222 start_codon:yes stop_codon:yes gene_type:complete